MQTRSRIDFKVIQHEKVCSICSILQWKRNKSMRTVSQIRDDFRLPKTYNWCQITSLLAASGPLSENLRFLNQSIFDGRSQGGVSAPGATQYNLVGHLGHRRRSYIKIFVIGLCLKNWMQKNNVNKFRNKTKRL